MINIKENEMIFFRIKVLEIDIIFTSIYLRNSLYDIIIWIIEGQKRRLWNECQMNPLLLNTNNKKKESKVKKVVEMRCIHMYIDR